MKTKVIFRKFKEGDILALFPYEKYNNKLCMSYQHIGQHSGADYNYCIKKTKAANKQEYISLYKELTQIGYNLKIIKRKGKKV